ncbi:MAG: bifunctional phosphoribosyl-AMP cyclohydrolase/phosphoribosyl-ATP diphosphatase HisIE [Candidatus Puniceispirillaceae bacterium]
MAQNSKGGVQIVATNLDQIDWEKGEGLVPAIIQDIDNGQVLMLGYMNRDALAATLETGNTTFFSRSKQRLWMKGETTGNRLIFIDGWIDCDRDTLLLRAQPVGPACHTGDRTCFVDEMPQGAGFIGTLNRLVHQRHTEMPAGSYTTSLFESGKARIAQKVGEEGVELALARMKDDRAEIANEAADLLYHMLVLLADADMDLGDVTKVLAKRHSA